MIVIGGAGRESLTRINDTFSIFWYEIALYLLHYFSLTEQEKNYLFCWKNRVKEIYLEGSAQVLCSKTNAEYRVGRRRPEEGALRDLSSDEEGCEFDPKKDFCTLNYTNQLRQTSLAAHGVAKTKCTPKAFKEKEIKAQNELNDFIEDESGDD